MKSIEIIPNPNHDRIFCAASIRADKEQESSSWVDVSDSSTARRLKSFTKRVVKKVDYPVIREPPKQPPAMPVLPWRSRRLAAQRLSRISASKRGEVLIMQRMGFTKGPSTPSVSELAAYDKLFGVDLIASESEALDELFPAVRARQPRGRKCTS